MQIISPIDFSVDQWLWQHRAAWLVKFFLYFTYLGEAAVVAVLTLVFMGYFWRKKAIAKTWALMVAVMGSAGTTFILKHLFARPRPSHEVYQELLASFPSAHATMAVAFYGLLFYFLIKDLGQPCCRKFWYILSALFIILLGFSRLYLGVHYLSDVLAGYLVGLIWFAVAVYVEKRLKV